MGSRQTNFTAPREPAAGAIAFGPLHLSRENRRTGDTKLDPLTDHKRLVGMHLNPRREDILTVLVQFAVAMEAE